MSDVKVRCPFCWEVFRVEVHKEDGDSQQLIVDCEVCCHPLNLDFYRDGKKWRVQVDKGEGF